MNTATPVIPALSNAQDYLERVVTAETMTEGEAVIAEASPPPAPVFAKVGAT